LKILDFFGQIDFFGFFPSLNRDMKNGVFGVLTKTVGRDTRKITFLDKNTGLAARKN